MEWSLITKTALILLIYTCNHADGSSATVSPRIFKEIQEFESAFNSPDWFLDAGVDEAALKAQLAAGQPLSQSSVSAKCLEGLLVQSYGTSNYQQWAVYMRDANGRAMPGIYAGNFLWLGSHDQCIRKETKATNWETPEYSLTHNFDGQYCKLNYYTIEEIKRVSIGLCAPSTCSESDLTAIFNGKLFNSSSTRAFLGAECVKDTALGDSTAAIVATVVLGLVGVLVLVATVVEYRYKCRNNCKKGCKQTSPASSELQVVAGSESVTRSSLTQSPKVYEAHQSSPGADVEAPSTNGEILIPEAATGSGTDSNNVAVKSSVMPGKGLQALFSFSLISTVPRVLSSTSPPGSYDCMHGIRFLTFTWIALGHVWQLGLYVTQPGVTAAENFWQQYTLQESFPHEAINEMSVSVETFFVLSACLVTISFMKTMSRQNDRVTLRQMALYYFHRYWRLTPVYMVILGGFVCFSEVAARGPNFPHPFTDADNCKRSFWANLLYLNNIWSGDLCMGWTWYLANDFQFYAVAPFFIFFMFRWPYAGVGLVVVAYLNHMAVSGYIFHEVVIGKMEYFGAYYFPPWTRFGPYAIGMLLGFIMYRYKRTRCIHTALVSFGWYLSIFCIVWSVYGSSWIGPGVGSYVAHFVLQRSLFAVGVSWVIFACCFGYGGWINQLLSWKFFVPLSKITYIGYLIHPIMIYSFYYASTRLIYVNVTNVVVYYGALLFYCTLVSFLVKVVFEEPFMLLEKAIIPKQKKQA